MDVFICLSYVPDLLILVICNGNYVKSIILECVLSSTKALGIYTLLRLRPFNICSITNMLLFKYLNYSNSKTTEIVVG